MVKMEITLPKIPRTRTVYEWYKLYPDAFSQLFSDAYVEPLEPIFSELTLPTANTTPEKIFRYFLRKQFNRMILPRMETEDINNSYIIEHMKEIIALRSYGLKYKYDMLAQTLPDNISDLYNNYNMTRQYTKGKTFTKGTVKHSGSDHTYSNVDISSEEYSTTGDNASPRLKSKSTRKTLPDGQIDSPSNSVNTTYGRQIETTPGSETDTFNQTASGYYNSGTKAKMIEEIRDLASINIVDQWLHDIMPVFCMDVFDTSCKITIF